MDIAILCETNLLRITAKPLDCSVEGSLEPNMELVVGTAQWIDETISLIALDESETVAATIIETAFVEAKMTAEHFDFG